MGHSIPTPPLEDHKSSSSRRNSPSSKTSRSTHRASKRASTQVITAAAAAASHSGQHSPVTSESRHKRVWKACERCRMKKTKCDGEFPCKRCKDDGLVCTAGVRKKTEYKQLPRGYAEVLESTQFALVATIHKLYAMVRNSETWELGEPELNDRGEPIVHNIATKLGCIRPNSDIDLPVHSIFPEDEAGLTELVRRLEEQEQERRRDTENKAMADDVDSSCNRTERASSSELDHSDFEDEYKKNVVSAGAMLSPESLPPYGDFESAQPDMGQASSLFPPEADISGFPMWGRGAVLTPEFLQQASAFSSVELLNQGLLESEFGTLKPHVVSCPNPEVMMGIGDPMIYSGYDAEMRI